MPLAWEVARRSRTFEKENCGFEVKCPNNLGLWDNFCHSLEIQQRKVPNLYFSNTTVIISQNAPHDYFDLRVLLTSVQMKMSMRLCLTGPLTNLRSWSIISLELQSITFVHITSPISSHIDRHVFIFVSLFVHTYIMASYIHKIAYKKHIQQSWDAQSIIHSKSFCIGNCYKNNTTWKRLSNTRGPHACMFFQNNFPFPIYSYINWLCWKCFRS